MARDPWIDTSLGPRNNYEKPTVSNKPFSPLPGEKYEPPQELIPEKARPEPDLSQPYTEDRGLLDFLNELLEN